MKSAIAFVTAAAALAVITTADHARADSLDGMWRGSGYVSPTSGKREKVSCKVRYDQQSSTVFGVKATCASPSANIRQTGQVLKVNANRYVGDFYNSDYDIAGRVRVIVNGSKQTVTFSSANGSGSLSLSKR